MNISNTHSSKIGNTNFCKKSIDLEKMTDEELVYNAIKNSAKIMQEFCKDKMPENGKYNNIVGIHYCMPNGKIFEFTAVHDEIEPQNQRRIKLSVNHPNSDLCYESYIFKGTKAEVIDYFSKLDLEKMYQQIMNLSSKVDEYYNS